MLPMTCDQKTGITFNLYVRSKIEYYQLYKTKNAFVSGFKNMENQYHTIDSSIFEAWNKISVTESFFSSFWLLQQMKVLQDLQNI